MLLAELISGKRIITQDRDKLYFTL